MELRKIRLTAMIAEARAVMEYRSCLAATQAFSLLFMPMYCEATTAPPVARAEKIWIRRMLMESTSEIPETAASPTLATMIVSERPIVTARNCSATSGRIRRVSAWRENIPFSISAGRARRSFPLPMI